MARIRIHLPQRSRGRREPHWLAIALIAAFLGAVFTALITTSTLRSGAENVSDWFEGTPSVEERYVSQFVDDARDPRRWTGEPIVFPEAVDYLKRKFSTIDPRTGHQFSKSDGLYVPLEALLHNPKQASGPVITLGQVVSAAVTGGEEDRHTIEVVLADPAIRTFDYLTVEGLVICRSTMPRQGELPPGRLIMFVSGVPLAKGPMRTTWGGFVNAIYMICGAGTSALTTCGRSPVPNFPDINCKIAGQPLVPRPPTRRSKPFTSGR